MLRMAHSWQDLVPVTMEVFKQACPAWNTYHYGFTASLALYLREINDYKGRESMWAVMNSEMVSAILYNNGKA